MNEVVKVGIADLKWVHYPCKIGTSGLGSCVGVVIYDEKNTVGLAHVMLPDANIVSKNKPFNVAKFANTALESLLHLLLEHGAKKPLKAKIAGGAQMFKFASATDGMKIGQRNIAAVKDELLRLGIPIVAEDCGGHSGRTIEFNSETSMLTIRTINTGAKEI